MTAAALKTTATTSILIKADPSSPAFRIEGRTRIFLKAGTVVSLGAGGIENASDHEIVINPGDLLPGTDFAIFVSDEGEAFALPAGDFAEGPVQIGGFHFAPGGNATGRAGGDSEPAINPFSCWDLNFRPACPDASGMAVVDMPGGKVWVDIYKLGVDHLANGTSRFGEKIADGDDLPQSIDGKGRAKAMDYPTAVAILAHHGKQLLSYDEFHIAALGVTEKTAAARDPNVTGLDAARTSQRGIMQATGNLWDWGHDGDPDDRRASIFGGSWFDGSGAGSGQAGLGCWPGGSHDVISARGRSDHMQLA